MLACLLLLTACLLGVLIAARLRLPVGPLTQVGIGTALGQVAMLWLPFLAALIGNLNARSAGLTALALQVVGCTALSFTRGRTPTAGLDFLRAQRESLTRRSQRLPLICGACLLALFAWLLHTHYFESRPDGLYSAGVTWGDLPIHLALASRFLYAEGLPALEHPLFLNGPLTYPFLPDYSVAVLSALGLSLHWAFVLGSLLPLSALMLLVHGLARAWNPDAGAEVGALALCLFLFAGGLGFALFGIRLTEGTPFLQLLATTNATYMDPWVLKSGQIGNLLIAARNAAYGLPIAASALLLLGLCTERVRTPLGVWLAAGVAIGSLPLVHSHSFIVLCAVAAAYPLLNARERAHRAAALAEGAGDTDASPARGFWTGLLCCYIALGVCALPQLWWLSHAAESHFVRLSFGFLREAQGLGSWASDLALGMGVWLLAVPLAYRSASARARRLSLPLLAMFPLANVVTFTPATYDNVKLLAWFDLGAALLLAGVLTRERVSHGHTPALRRAGNVLLVIGCTLSGALAVGFELTNDGFVMSRDDVEFAHFVARRTPASAIIATAASYHDPIALLSGRRVLVACPSMLETHGIDVRARARDVLALYAGGRAAREVMQRLKVSVVVVGPQERHALPHIDEAFLRSESRAIDSYKGRRLYILH